MADEFERLLGEALAELPQSRQAELRSHTPGLSDRLVNYVTDLVYGDQANAQQRGHVNQLIGAPNPINLPAQAEEGVNALMQGVRRGDAAQIGQGAVGVAAAIPFLPLPAITKQLFRRAKQQPSGTGFEDYDRLLEAQREGQQIGSYGQPERQMTGIERRDAELAAQEAARPPYQRSGNIQEALERAGLPDPRLTPAAAPQNQIDQVPVSAPQTADSVPQAGTPLPDQAGIQAPPQATSTAGAAAPPEIPKMSTPSGVKRITKADRMTLLDAFEANGDLTLDIAKQATPHLSDNQLKTRIKKIKTAVKAAGGDINVVRQIINAAPAVAVGTVGGGEALNALLQGNEN